MVMPGGALLSLRGGEKSCGAFELSLETVLTIKSAAGASFAAISPPEKSILKKTILNLCRSLLHTKFTVLQACSRPLSSTESFDPDRVCPRPPRTVDDDD